MTTTVDIKNVDYTTEMQENGQPKAVMNILGRNPDNEFVHIRNEDIQPHFCVLTEEFDDDLKDDERVVDWEDGYTSIYGHDLTRVYTRIPGDVPKVRGDYEHYEADILFPNRWLIDSGIYDSITVPDKYDNDDALEISLDELEATTTSTDTRIFFCDIEVDDEKGFPDESEAEEEIISISLYDSFKEEYHVYYYHPKNPDVSHDEAEVHMFTDEADMMSAFCEHIVTEWPDVLAGWNFKDFDARYIVNRLDKLQGLSADDISPLGTAYDDGSWSGGKIRGISVFDMLKAYKNLQYTELDSYSLEEVAQSVLGYGKIQDNRRLYEQWEDDPQQLLDYNVQDVKLTVELEEHEDIIKFNEEKAAFSGGRLAEVIDPSQAVDVYILHVVNEQGYVLPSAATVEGGESFEGAQVFDPSSGIKEMVEVLDLASLYPMSMKTLNAGPTTKDPDGDITAPNGVSFTTERQSLISGIIDDLLEERQDKKDLRDQNPPGSDDYIKYDRQQGAVKVIMNCFSDDTDVVTPQGIRNIRDLDIGDEVYSINPDTKDIEIKRVIDTVQQPNMFGELKHIDTNHTDLKITPNHRMVVENGDRVSIRHYDELDESQTHRIPNHNSYDGYSYGSYDIGDIDDARIWLDPDMHGRKFRNSLTPELGNALLYKKPRTAFRLDDMELYREYQDEIHQKCDDVKIQYGDNHASIPVRYNLGDLLELIGWFISEGSLTHHESDDYKSGGMYRGESKRVNIAQDDKSNRERIKALADSMGINYTSTDKGVYISNSVLYEWFMQNCGKSSEDKRIPEWVFDNKIDSSQLSRLLDSAILGDGDKTGEGSYRYSTKSDELRDDIVRLSVLCGWKAQYSKDGDIWRIYINSNEGSFKRNRVESEAHDGDVYCVTVEDNNTLMAGRNGKFQWTGNTLYGVMGWDRFRLYDKDVGAAVTSVGRECIKFTQTVVSEMGHEVIYGDTDSVMVELGNTVSARDAIEVGHTLEVEINVRYDEFAEDVLNVQEHYFEIEFEKLYRRFFQAGKKKRYAGHVIWKEGKQVDDIGITGFEFRRSDYSTVAKELQKDVLDKIVRGSTFMELSNLIQHELKRIQNGYYSWDELGIPGSIGQAFEKYDSKTLTVKGAEYANENLGAMIQPGDKPRGIYIHKVLSDDLPPLRMKTPYVCWMNEQTIDGVVPDKLSINWEKYIDVQVKGPLSRIFEGTEWSWGGMLSGQEQGSMFDYGESDDDDGMFEDVTIEQEPVIHANGGSTTTEETTTTDVEEKVEAGFAGYDDNSDEDAMFEELSMSEDNGKEPPDDNEVKEPESDDDDSSEAKSILDEQEEDKDVMETGGQTGLGDW